MDDLKKLIKVNNRWSFRLGERFFDPEVFDKNLELIEYICYLAKKNKLNYAFSGIFGLIFNYLEAYRNAEDIDLIINRNDLRKWIDILHQEGWKHKDLANISDDIDISIKYLIDDSEKFCIFNRTKEYPIDSAFASTYFYTNNKFEIINKTTIFAPCLRPPNELEFDPNNNLYLILGEDSIQFRITSNYIENANTIYGFLYYTHNGDEPNGKNGIPSKGANILKLTFEKYNNKKSFWISEKLSKEFLKDNLKFKASLYYTGVLRFIDKHNEFTIDLIIDSPDRLSPSSMSCLNINKDLSLYYSKPNLIWEKKDGYNRKKDQNDAKFYKKILSQNH